MTVSETKAYVCALSTEDRASSQVFETSNDEDAIGIIAVWLLQNGYSLDSIRIVKDYNMEKIHISIV
jgi:hypothetical protein